MNQPKLALALLGAVGASGAFAIWWLRGDGDFASKGSRIETVSSAGPRDPDLGAALDLISVRFQDDGHYCHWHSGNRLNSPAWWLAEYYRGLPERRPSDAQIDELEALLATIELQLNAADTAIDAELTPAVKGKIRRREFKSFDSKTDQKDGPDLIPSRAKHEGWLLASLPDGYSAEIRLLRDDVLGRVKILEGERPSLDVPLDAKATLHHDAPKRIRRLIESFK